MAAATALALSSLGGTEPPTVTEGRLKLDWRAPRACPSQAELRATLTATLDPAHRFSRDLQVRAEVTQREANYHLDLKLWAGEAWEQRNIVEADCRVLAEAVVLIVSMLEAQDQATPPEDAVARGYEDELRGPEPLVPAPGASLAAVDPGGAAREQSPGPAKPEPALDTGQAAPPEEVSAPTQKSKWAPAKSAVARARAPSRPRTGWWTGLAGGGGLGRPLQIRGEWGAAYGGRNRSLGASLNILRAFGPSGGARPSNYELELYIVSATVRGCALWRRALVTWPICVGAEIGALTARSWRGSAERRSAGFRWFVWAEASLSTGLALRLSPRLDLATRVDFTVPLHSFDLTAGPRAEPVFSVPRFGARMLMGLRLHFLTRKPRGSGT